MWCVRVCVCGCVCACECVLCSHLMPSGALADVKLWATKQLYLIKRCFVIFILLRILMKFIYKKTYFMIVQMHNKTSGRQWNQLVHDMSWCVGRQDVWFEEFLPSQRHLSKCVWWYSVLQWAAKMWTANHVCTAHISDLVLSIHNAHQLCYELWCTIDPF